MGNTNMRINFALIALLFISAGLLFLGGCARYARNVNTLYEPSTTVSGGSGEVYIVIPDSQVTRSPDIKWVVGKVKNDEDKQIDEVFSPRSPSEITQSALAQEFKKAGYTIFTVSKRPETASWVIDLTSTEIDLEQISSITDIKAKCRILLGVDVIKNGQMVKRLQYESSSSKRDIKDRDLLARNVLEDALQAVIRRAMPDLNSILVK